MARQRQTPQDSHDVSRETHPPHEYPPGAAIPHTPVPIATILVEIPLAPAPCDPIPHYVDVQLRSAAARAGLARLRDGAIAAGMRVGVDEADNNPGRPVTSAADAVRALLEQLGRN